MAVVYRCGRVVQARFVATRLDLHAEAERADHGVVFPQMIMKRPGEYMMIAFFQTMFVFGHRPWKVADPKSRDHMGVWRVQPGSAQCTYEAVVGTYASAAL